MSALTLLIDGDHVLYTASAAVEREVRWDDENHVLFSNADEAFSAFERSINGYRETLKADKVIIAFSGAGNFRKDLDPTYKAGRSRKPLCYSRLIKMIHVRYSANSADLLEGDDLLGIWATRGDYGDSIIVAEDKDLKTIPGRLYRKGELLEISELEANRNWLMQTLTGDPTDGYPGCPGYGEVKSQKLLELSFGGKNYGPIGTPEECVAHAWPRVVNAFEHIGLTADDALLQARLARILRGSDYKGGKVDLWTP